MYVLLAALLACSCAAPQDAPGQERAWSSQDPRQIVARFAGQTSVELTPEQAFRARQRCAAVTRAVVTPLPAGAARRPATDAAPDVAGLRVEVEGVGLERVTRIAAHLPAPARAEGLAQRHRDTEQTDLDGRSDAVPLRPASGSPPPTGEALGVPAFAAPPGEDASAGGGAASGSASTGPRPRRSASTADREGGPPPPPPQESQTSVVMPAPALADIKVVRTDGKLVFPVFCRTCDIVLGVPLDGTAESLTVGCRGPGWSLRFRDGTLASE